MAMKHGAIGIVLALGALGPSSAACADSPWIHSGMTTAVRDKIEVAYAVAVERLSRVPACRELFAQLGGDGEHLLATSLYLPMPNVREELAICRGRKAHAATMVGAASTFICPSFGRIPDDRAAMVLIHEALHHAGLNEYPHDPNAMRSSQISALVGRSCRLKL